MSPESNPHGFLLGGRPEDLFRGTAPYYARYRRPYPPEVVNHLVGRCGLDGPGDCSMPVAAPARCFKFSRLVRRGAGR